MADGAKKFYTTFLINYEGWAAKTTTQKHSTFRRITHSSKRGTWRPVDHLHLRFFLSIVCPKTAPRNETKRAQREIDSDWLASRKIIVASQVVFLSINFLGDVTIDLPTIFIFFSFLALLMASEIIAWFISKLNLQLSWNFMCDRRTTVGICQTFPKLCSLAEAPTNDTYFYRLVGPTYYTI